MSLGPARTQGVARPRARPCQAGRVQDVVVVGSGPNGLAAAVVLARAGLGVTVLEEQPTVGGGARTLDLGLAPGLVHDICSAVHPMAVASEFFARFDLAARGVELVQPELAYAHPLDGGRAALAWRDLDRTADGLGRDGRAWRSLLGPLVEHQDGVLDVALSDHRRLPRDLLGALLFGLRVAEQGTPAWSLRFRGEAAPALLTGVAMHAIAPMPSLRRRGRRADAGRARARDRLAGAGRRQRRDRRGAGRRPRGARRDDRDRAAGPVARPTCRTPG